jgi:hypothetical protein
MDHPRIEKGTLGVDFLLLTMFLVRARVLWLYLRIWEVKDQIRPLENLMARLALFLEGPGLDSEGGVLNDTI